MIDPRDGFVNVAACLRALTRPTWAPNAFFPYAALLERGRHVRDRGVSVDASGVSLADGSRVEADFIVLSTGSSYSYVIERKGRDLFTARFAGRFTREQTRTSRAGPGVGRGRIGIVVTPAMARRISARGCG